MIGVNSEIVRQFVRGLPLVRDLRGVLMNLDDRLASLERRVERNEPREYMDQALAVVSEFWRSYDLRVEPDCPPILVDLFHSNAEYLWRNLVIAKLVQPITAAPLVGLIGEPGVVGSGTGGQISRGDNVLLANAFGVNLFIDVPNEDALGAAERPGSVALADLAASQRDGTPLAPTAIARLREVRTESGF